MAGHLSITIETPAARVRPYAASSTTPSWNQTAFAPTATAWSATSPASELFTNTSTTSGMAG
ncbi:hypothetical protein KAURM247S_07417 [Kitasatospora aureofaciens]